MNRAMKPMMSGSELESSSSSSGAGATVVVDGATVVGDTAVVEGATVELGITPGAPGTNSMTGAGNSASMPGRFSCSQLTTSPLEYVCTTLNTSGPSRSG